MEQATFLEAATVDQDGFQQQWRRRTKNSQQQQQQQSWVWGGDALQDWISSSPVQDWQREQWMGQCVQQWEHDAARGLAGDTAVDGAGYEPTGYNGPQEAYAFISQGTDAAESSTGDGSNPFAVLAAESGDAEAFGTFLAQLQDLASGSSAGTSLQLQQTDAGWLLLEQPTASGRGTTAADVSDEDSEGWELASMGSDNAANSTSKRPPAAAAAPGALQVDALNQAQHNQKPSDAAGALAAAGNSRQAGSIQGSVQVAATSLSGRGVVAAAVPPEVLELEGSDRHVEELLLLQDTHTA
jgi:hypothetical protein